MQSNLHARAMLILPRFYLILSGLVSISGLSAQNFKDEELVRFYHLYQYELNHPFDLPAFLPLCVSKSGISRERVAEIMQAQVMGYNPKLTEREKQELEKIQKCLEEQKEKHDAEFVDKIKKAGFTQKRYEEIKRQFVADRSLQEKTYHLVKQ